MAQKISQQVLDDFMATLATNPNADRKQLMQAFPEFGNDEKLLDAAYDYRETRLQNPMADMQTINSKFPEFFREPIEQQQGVSHQIYQNPAITTNSWEGKDLDDLTAEDYENYLAYAAKQKQQPQQPTGGKIYASPSTLDVMEHFGNAFVKGPLAANKEYMEKMEEKALAEQHSEQRKREKRSSLPLSKQDMALMGGVWSTVGEKPYPSLTKEDLDAQNKRFQTIDKSKLPSYLTREEKTMEDVYQNVVEAWGSNTLEGRAANYAFIKKHNEISNAVSQGKISAEDGERQISEAANEFFAQALEANEDYIKNKERIIGNQMLGDVLDEKITKAKEAEKKAPHVGGVGAINGPIRFLSHSMTLENATLELLNDAKKMRDAALSNNDNAWSNFWKGMGHSLGDIDTWDFGLGQWRRNEHIKDLTAKLNEAEKAGKDIDKFIEELPKNERDFLDAFCTFQQACLWNSDELSAWYKAGTTTGEAIPFIAETLMTGLTGIGKGVAKSIAKRILKSSGKEMADITKNYLMRDGATKLISAFGQGTGVLGGAFLEGTAQSFIFGTPKIASGIEERMRGEVITYLDSHDNTIRYGGIRPGTEQGWLEAAYNSTLDNVIENISERALEAFTPFIKVGKGRVGNWLAGNKMFNSISSKDWYRVIRDMHNAPWAKELLQNIHFGGYTQEVLEEELGGLMRLMCTDVNTLKEAGLDTDSQTDILIGLLPMSLGFGAMQVGGAAIQYSKYKHSSKEIRSHLSSDTDRAIYDKILKGNMDDITNDARELIRSTLENNKYSTQKKQEIIEDCLGRVGEKLSKQVESADSGFTIFANDNGEEVIVPDDVVSRYRKQAKEEANQFIHPNGMVYYFEYDNEQGNPQNAYIVGGDVIQGENGKIVIEGDVTVRSDNGLEDFWNLRNNPTQLNATTISKEGLVDKLTRQLVFKKAAESEPTDVIQQEIVIPREEVIRQEVVAEVSPNTHKNGYVYPVKQPGENGKAGYIVNGDVTTDVSDQEHPVIANNDVVTVRWEDGTVEQLAAKDLDLISTPEPADNIVATLTEQRLAAEAQQAEAEQAAQNLPEGVVEFTNGNETMAVVDNGDGTYQLLNSDGTPDANSISAEQLAENGYAMIPREQVAEQPAATQEPQQPAAPAPVIPNIETMSAEELGASAVEYMGDKASATAYLEAERDKADAEVKRTAKLKVGRFEGIEDFKRQNDQIQAAKRAAIDRYNKLQNAITAANAYKTLAEQKEEAERKAREAALREQRRQLAEAETAGDIEAKWQNTKKTVGFAATKTLPNGQKVNGHYILTEAGDVIPSHDPRKNYADSEGYVMENGQNVNDNNYKDPDVQRIALDIAQNYGGQAVEQMPFLENKAGRVLSGNNRTISGIIAAENNTDQAYLAALAENAQQYGFTPEQLAEYQHPRLQFVIEDELPFTTATFAMFNQQEKKTKSSVNRAVANSKMVTEAVRDRMLEIMDQYESLDSFFGSETAASDIVQALITEGLMTQQEVAGLTENTGAGFKFGQSGREYVTDMLLGTLFDEQTIKMLAGEKTLKQAILRALPSIVANRRLKGYELTDSINNAIQLLYEARKANEGKSTADAFQLYLRQVDAFKGSVKDRYNGFDIILAGNMSAGVEQLREILGLYNNSAMNEANGQMGFFEPRTIDDIKQDVYEYYTKQQPELAAALNGAAATGAQPQSAVPSGVANEGDARQEGIEPEQTQEDAETNEPKVWTEQELSSKILSEKEKEELLDRIKDDKTPVVVVHNADFAQVLAAEGAPKSIQDQINRYIASGVSLNGVSYNGKVFVNFDAVQTGIDVIKAYVHERQHLFTKADPAYKDVVKANATAGELHEVVKAISNSDAYDIYLKMGKYGQDVLADEFISHIMQEVYALGAEADNLAQIYGINNTEILKTLKTLDDEQRNDANLSKARRNALVGSSNQGTSGQNERNSQPGSERDLGGQGLRPAGSSNQRTGIGAEQVTPFEKTRLGLVAAEFRRQYPDAAVGVLFREKDTYEFYDKDAVRAAEILGLQTTEKDGVPFLSFPLDKLQDYLGKLVRGGMKIGITRKPDHKPTKGDYQIGDSFTYDGKTATIQDFTYFGTAILDVDGRRVEVSREQLDDILESPTENRETTETKASDTKAAEIEIGGALVDRLGDMGLNVSTDLAANQKALKAAKKDKSEAGTIHYFKTPSSKQYGFAYKGKVYLDPTKINAELPIHEYGHLWAEALRRLNPENWQRVVDTIKADKEAWAFVRELRPELTDENEITEEVIATFSGKNGAEKMRAEYERMHGKDADYKSKWGNIFKNISKAIQDFWKAVGDFLNIRYESAEQVYDQVLKDFVDNMNPWKRVSDYLQARDKEYVQAAERGDIKTATNLFYDALKENIGNGITPYMSVGTYTQLKRLAKGVKTRNEGVIKEAAAKIAPLIPDNAVLIPAPSHDGRAKDMLDLAKAVAEITGSEVADVLRSAPRESQYQAKKATGVPMASGQLGITMEGTLPEGKMPIIIDNVVDSGNTAEACVQAVGRAVVVTIGDSAEQYRHAASLKSAAPVLRDKAGKVIPLSKRFEPKGSRYLGRRMYLSSNDPRFAISGTQVIPVTDKTLVGLHNISAEKLRKALKMGGLANPSTAVINIATQSHEGYGAISLIMPSRLVDSDTGRNAGTFTGDIWSPTYPHVEKQMSDKGDDAYYTAITKAFGDNKARRPILSRAKLDFDDYLDSGNIRAGLAYWYLLEKGIEPGDVYFNSGISDDIKERFRPLYDKGILDLTKEDYRTLLSLIAEQQGKTAEDMLQDAQESKARYQQTIDDPEAKQFYKKIAQQAIDEIDLYGVRYNVLSNGYHAMERAVREDGKIDLDSTLIAAQDIVQTQHQADFDKWISDMDERFDISEVLFQDYDRDGNRIYKPHTLANVSRMMNKEDLQNAGDHGGLSATRGILMRRLETLADIRAEKGRLRPGTEEDIETEEWNKMQDEWFEKVLNPLSDMQKISDNPFSNVGYAETRLQEALRTKDPIATLNKEYRYHIDKDSQWAKDLADMVERVKNLPTKYFETKFRRPVYLNEFANAVVPNDLPQDLRAGLESAGLRLFSYDPNAQGSRRDATLKATEADGIRFSINGNHRSSRGTMTGYNGMQSPVFADIKDQYLREMADIKDKAIKDGTFMQAPNGKPSRLNERQWLQVRTRAFKRWFGDWQNDPENASKVLDENGEPMVVYHGSNRRFNVFKYGDLGFHFGTQEQAEVAAEGQVRWNQKGRPNIIQGFLNIRNPYRIEYDPETWNELGSNFMRQLLDEGIIDRKDWDNLGYDGLSYKQMQSIREKLQIAGYDGVIYPNWYEFRAGEDYRTEFDDSYIALSPNQIKSATNNNGDFSEENDDIRFSISNQNNDIFYSNAERAVEGIKQEKATPEQWRAMIEKAGGLKAGEDKWIGLSDWLAQQRPTVELQPNETRSQYIARLGEATKRFTLTKQQVLDYIRNNKIQIEETHYQEGLSEDAQQKLDDYRAEFDEYFAEGEEATGSLYMSDYAEYAWNQMIERYGDDFEQAFELDKKGSGRWTIEPQTDYYGGDLSEAAKFFLDSDTDNRPIESTRLRYTTYGLDNKREIALTVPTIEPWNDTDEVHFGDAGGGRAIAWIRFGETHHTTENGAQIPEDVLVIDEIQSKRHQSGREQGYQEHIDRPGLHVEEYIPSSQNPNIAFARVTDENGILYGQVQRLSDGKYRPHGSNLQPIGWTDYNTEEEAFNIVKKEAETLNEGGVPDAPFEKNWHELAMKRILRFAAENGYDKVAWTTGEQQAKRYDLGKQLEAISVFYNDETGLYDVHVTDKGYDPMDDSYTLEEGLDDEGLKRTIGKDLYNRVMEQGKQDGWDGGVELTGDDLVIGTDGMRGFYDDILPRFMQKYGKKWGVQVGEVTMPQLEDGYQTMHAIDINDAMRESVMEGQPMFSISGRGVNGTMKPQEGETRSQYIARVAETVKNMTPRNTTIDDAIRFSITVNHNSPYLLKRADGAFVDPETGERLGFDHRFMGKGEGGQAHGWGSYFSVNDIRSYGDGYGFSLRDIKDAFNTSRWQSFGVGDAFDVAKGYLLEAHSEKAPSLRKWLEDRLAQKQELLKNYEGKVANTAEEGLMVFRAEADVQYIPALLRDMVNDIDTRNRHHYSVEIPDNDGTNYLDETKTLPKPLRRKIAAAVRELPGEPMPSVKYVNYTGGWRQLGDMIERNQWAYLEIRDRLFNAFGGYPIDSEKKLSKLMSSLGFVGVHYDGRRDGECYVIFDENDAVITDHIRFSVSNPSTLSRSETVTKALVQQANNNYNIMQSALKKVTADLKGIRAAMRMQSDYDRKVVDALLNLYNTLLQENGVWAQYMPDTTRRIATQIVHAIGKQNITEEVNTIMDHMVHAQAKAAQRQWDKLRQTPIDKINISGVVMQGKVALEGQHALKAMNDALQANLTIEQIEEQINQLMDMEDNATDESLKTQYKGQWIGLTIAAQHLERLQHLQEERQQLDLELQSARSNKALKPAARQQLLDNIKQAMRDNYIEQAEAYTRSTQDLSEYVNTQEGRAKDFIRRQDANRDKIRSYAQRDLEGLATNPNRNRTRGNVARSIWDAFASPIRDLQSLLRLTGLHAPDGEGYLYNHFMRNWMDGADMERTGIVAASKTLDEKIAELTHGKYKTWEEAARKINDASHNMFGITMLNGVDGKDMPVTEEIPLNAGNALYIYAVNKMNDGRMKLNGMNITEEDVQALADKVREQFGQEILDVVDWVQSEFFSQLRNRYNPTHEALFGAPMDAIENYFPLRINANARQQNEDLSEPDTDAARLLAGTSTGAIKRRTRNSLPLDVRNADFFQEVIRHISQMERWNAFAQWNRDANILFSDINFRNRIKGMKGTIYGEGDKLYNYMKDAFRVAIGTYKPNADGFSKEILNAAKGVTSAKINFRVFTALKQIASFPAFFTYMQDGTFVTSYLRNWLTPHSTMKWAKENLPNFEKRVSKRDLGDMRLMSRSTDWQWNKRILEWSSKYGMFFNVFFDTLTCATGARAVYDSHLADYMKKGYSEEDARNRARQDAEQAFNTSQQSSEGAFMSAVQMDRNLVTAALTVFRTSPIQYTRNFFYHTRNLLRKFGEGKRDEQIAFRMGQYKNDGLNDEQARKAAEKDYNKSLRQDIVGFVVYGALLNLLWRLVGQAPYLFFGDDDDKKKQIFEEATSGGAWFSPFTGLLGGGIVESALDGNGSVADMFAPEMPFTQDIKRAGQYLSNDKYAEFASQALSVLMQSGTGFDPLTASDMVSRIVTTLDSEEELDAATQALRVSQALLSIPQSQYEQMLIDKVVSGETDEDAALEDYIRYQKIHTAPLTWWLRGEESDEKAEENAEKRFNRLLNERDELHNPEEE